MKFLHSRESFIAKKLYTLRDWLIQGSSDNFFFLNVAFKPFNPYFQNCLGYFEAFIWMLPWKFYTCKFDNKKVDIYACEHISWVAMSWKWTFFILNFQLIAMNKINHLNRINTLFIILMVEFVHIIHTFK